MAAVLNGASNALNQIYDLEIDRINKPHLPLAAGDLSPEAAWRIVAVAAAMPIVLGLTQGAFETGAVVAALIVGAAYSLPPVRLKRFPVAAALCIAGVRSAVVNLGVYGHFALASPAGSFTSFNLATAGTGSHSGPTCSVDANGHGGSSAQPADRSDYSVAFCPVPNAILLSSNLTNGQTGTAHITFGFTKLMNNPAQENLPLANVADFQIVATQHGVLPTDPNN